MVKTLLCDAGTGACHTAAIIMICDHRPLCNSRTPKSAARTLTRRPEGRKPDETMDPLEHTERICNIMKDSDSDGSAGCKPKRKEPTAMKRIVCLTAALLFGLSVRAAA